MFTTIGATLTNSPTLSNQQPCFGSFEIENISDLDRAEIDPVDHFGELLD